MSEPPESARCVAVYGAGGYTGRLLCAALAERGLPMILVGREEARLRPVAQALEGVDVEVAQATLDDRAALRRAFRGAAVVANCAGPFAVTGEPILRAAMETGSHYLDTTGEQTWIKRVYDELDGPLRQAGVAAVPGMGFDYVPGDLLCHLVGSRCQPLSELLVAYHMEGFGMTRGTMRSSLEMLKGDDVTYRDGRWVPAGSGPLRAFVDFPAPIGRRQVGKFPCGEVVTAPHHLDVATVRSAISLESLVPGPLTWLLPPALPAVALAMRSPVAGLLDRAIGLLPEGPPEPERRATRWTILVRATGADGAQAVGVVRGTDVYGLTAQTMAAGVQRMAAPTFERAGAHAPASAFQAAELLAALAPFGVSWEAI